MEERVLAGRYRLIEQLGQGGMGSVWRAHDLTLHNQVAIKLIDPAIAESSEILERFEREALAAAELRSTHIVQVFDYGVDDGVPFIAMELLEGESLANRLDRVGRLNLDATAAVLTQVARALSRAHEKGIVHRDLKPDNVFIVNEADAEIVKVLDFGIAKKMDALSTASSTKTRTGALLGTPYYMSPEQALGRRSIDHRTDIWSMGVIAYECLTGIRPFDSESVGALLMSICHEPIPTPSNTVGVNPAFDAWFARAAAREPSARFATAVDAAAALRAICSKPSHASVDNSPIRGVPTTAVVVRDDPVAMLETISTASVTIQSRANHRRKSRRTLCISAGLGLALLFAASLWLKPSSTRAAPANSLDLPMASVAHRSGAPPVAPPTSTATPQLASNSIQADAPQSGPLANSVGTQKTPRHSVSSAKPSRRTTVRHENHAGF